MIILYSYYVISELQRRIYYTCAVFCYSENSRHVSQVWTLSLTLVIMKLWGRFCLLNDDDCNTIAITVRRFFGLFGEAEKWGFSQP